MPTKERIEELFDYKDGHLHFKTSRGNRKAGARAGTLRDNGYIVVSIGPIGTNRFFREHHLVWILFGGSVPPGREIDHINHQRADNRIENLRLVTRAGNRRNVAMSRRNTSGITGVYFNNSLKLWCARINDHNGKTMMLGCRKNKNEAIQLRREAEPRYGYTESHGLPLAA